jgi:hypothetical protein
MTPRALASLRRPRSARSETDGGKNARADNQRTASDDTKRTLRSCGAYRRRPSDLPRRITGAHRSAHQPAQHPLCGGAARFLAVGRGEKAAPFASLRRRRHRADQSPGAALPVAKQARLVKRPAGGQRGAGRITNTKTKHLRIGVHQTREIQGVRPGAFNARTENLVLFKDTYYGYYRERLSVREPNGQMWKSSAVDDRTR